MAPAHKSPFRYPKTSEGWLVLCSRGPLFLARLLGRYAGDRWLDSADAPAECCPYPTGTAEELAWEHGFSDALDREVLRRREAGA